MAVIQPRPTHILYECAKFGDDRTSFNVIFDVHDVNMKKAYTHIAVCYFIQSSKKIKKIGQSYSPFLLIFSVSVPNVVMIGRHLTSFLTYATFILTCNNSMAYLKNWTDNFFQIFFMGTSWVAVSINNIKTRAEK